MISAGVTSIGFIRSHNQAKRDDQAGDKGEAALRAFKSRLPVPYKTADLYAIASEDHYLRVYTSAGQHLFLERLSNAVHQLDAAPGLQTHRSWWVAETGIQSVRTQKGRIVLRLKDDETDVPVSRTFAPKVREAGWV